jgi:hypothetical protein
MKRRNFLASLAALVAAPKALLAMKPRVAALPEGVGVDFSGNGNHAVSPDRLLCFSVYVDGVLAEEMRWDRTLSDSEREQVEKYARARFTPLRRETVVTMKWSRLSHEELGRIEHYLTTKYARRNGTHEEHGIF